MLLFRDTQQLSSNSSRKYAKSFCLWFLISEDSRKSWENSHFLILDNKYADDDDNRRNQIKSNQRTKTFRCLVSRVGVCTEYQSLDDWTEYEKYGEKLYREEAGTRRLYVINKWNYTRSRVTEDSSLPTPQLGFVRVFGVSYSPSVVCCVCDLHFLRYLSFAIPPSF